MHVTIEQAHLIRWQAHRSEGRIGAPSAHSTVTDLARLRG